MRRNLSLLFLGLAIATPLVVGTAWGTRVAGGSDSWGYVSQAISWSKLDIQPQRPAIHHAPWPKAAASFTPLGYSTTQDGKRIVPTYAPGLPLLMSLPYRFFGLAGVFLVVPFFGALAVFLTHRLGKELGGEPLALVASLLTAVSPIFLYLAVQPMSDVPVITLWLAAIVALIRAAKTPPAAAPDSGRNFLWPCLAGLATALAILVRPNLVPLAGVLGLFLLVRTRKLRYVLAFAIGALPGIAAIAILNAYWYGSATRSGYGSLGELFSIHTVGANLARYPIWLIKTHTPMILLGLASPLLLRRNRDGEDRQSLRWLLLCFIAANFALYLPYFSFEHWSFLRFLLPSIPLLWILTCDVLFVLARRWHAGWANWVLVTLLAVFSLREAARRDVFRLREFEARYPAAAQMVQQNCGGNSVVLSMQHSGSLRLYAGVATLRWDALAPGRLERALAWLEQSGHAVCFALEPWEIEQFERRFAATRYARLAPYEVAQTHDVHLFRPR